MNKKCYQGGHKFEPRYDEVPIDRNITLNGPPLSAKKVRQLIVTKKYVKDVCIWCGKTIER